MDKCNRSLETIRVWWRSEGGVAEVLKLAWPMMLSTGLFAITLFVDRTLLYFHDRGSAAGALGAGTMFWAMTCGPVAMLGFTSTFVAQYVGVNQLGRALKLVKQGLLIALAFAPVVAFCAWGCRWFFNAFHQELAEVETQYFRWIAIGAWASIAAAPLNGLFAGTSRPKVILGVDIFATVFNALLDWILIFGVFGCPELGLVGAALATSISLTLKLVIMLVLASRIDWGRLTVVQSQAERSENDLDATSDSTNFLLSPWAIEWDLCRRFVYYGWPAAISALAESISFSIIVVLVGQLGTLYMDATTLALNINLIAFIPMVGLGQAVGVLVGQRLTGGRPETAKATIRTGLAIGFAYSLCFVFIFVFFPEASLAIYALGGDAARFEELKPIVLPILWFIAAYCVFDAIQIVLVGALKGAGDTFYVLCGNLVCGLICVSVGKILGDYFGGDIYWWWGVITAWVVSLAAFFTVRYLQGGWLIKRVIEPELL